MDIGHTYEPSLYTYHFLAIIVSVVLITEGTPSARGGIPSHPSEPWQNSHP